MPKKPSKLLEVLAVISIIGFTVSLLVQFPLRSGGKIPMISCISNEKQLGLAISQYTQDNDHNMPDIADAPSGRVTWRRAISLYINDKNVFLCPARRNKVRGPDGFSRSYAANYNGVGNSGKDDKGNGAFAGTGSKPVNIKDIPAPESLIMLCEFAGGNTPEFNIDDPVHFGPGKHLLWAGHAGGSDYLLADGHVKYLKPRATKELWHRDAAIPLSTNGVAVLAEAKKRTGE